MWRKATLRKCFEGSPARHCLDVCVQDVGCETREESASPMNGPGNNGEQSVIGVVNFSDVRTSVDIVHDFALRYPGNFEIGDDSLYRCTYARFIPQYYDFLVQAFVQYFDKLN